MGTEVAELLDAALPDSKAISDARRFLWGPGNSEVELNGEPIKIPPGTKIEVAEKRFFIEYFDHPYQTGFRVDVGVGGVEATEIGPLEARLCFCTLYYNAECKFLRARFHNDWL